MKQKIYGARQGSPFKKKEAQDIGEFIDGIDVKSTQNILDIIGKNKKHVIYKYIEWNDSIASDQYRLQQVRNIINHITIEVKKIGNKLPVRAYFSVKKPNNGNTTVYVDLDKTFTDEHYRDQVISRAKSELSNWRERYHQYGELSSIVGKISDFLATD